MMSIYSRVAERKVALGWFVLALLCLGLFSAGCATSQQAEAERFTLVVLPDTQYYADAQKNQAGERAIPDYSRYFYAQTQWIKDKRDELNIVMVAHVGDIVQSNQHAEWKIADKAFRTIDGLVPYIITPGNHDITTGKDGSRQTKFNDYFAPSRFEKEPWYAGHWGEGNESSYSLFEAGGMKFLIIALEFKPRDEVLEWANRVVAEHPDRRCIVVTHGYLLRGERIADIGYSYKGNSPEAIWQKFISRHENIFMVLSGHQDECRLTSTGKSGNTVYQLQSNYQMRGKGGRGYLRAMKFLPARNEIDVETYSPVIRQYPGATSSLFTLKYDMADAAKTGGHSAKIAMQLPEWREPYEKTKDSAVDLYIYVPTGRPNGPIIFVGAGFIIHKSGYVLTNGLLAGLKGQPQYVRLADGTQLPYRVVAANEQLAVAKIISDRTFKPVKIGSSADLKPDEMVFAVGAPGGMPHAIAAGRTLGLDADANQLSRDASNDMIYTDAPIMPGHLGGPLLNSCGEVVGMVAGDGMSQGQHVGIATPIETIMRHLPDALDIEGSRGFVVGMTVAGLGPAKVVKVNKNSPASAAGIKVGDVIASINGKPTQVGLDFYLDLLDRRGGDTLKLTLDRNGESVETTLTLGTPPMLKAVEVDGLLHGLNFEYYDGQGEQWSRLPAFDKMKPVDTGVVDTMNVKPYAGRDDFALRFTGYIRVPADGVYVFYTDSDDGSRLYVGDRRVVDNDGLHAAVAGRGYISLEAGLHPITVTYFDRIGGESLKVSFQGPGFDKSEIGQSELFH